MVKIKEIFFWGRKIKEYHPSKLTCDGWYEMWDSTRSRSVCMTPTKICFGMASFKQSNMAFVLPFTFSSSLLCSLFLFLCIFDSFFLATAIQLTEFNFVLQITTHQSVTKFCLQRRRQQRHMAKENGFAPQWLHAYAMAQGWQTRILLLDAKP